MVNPTDSQRVEANWPDITGMAVLLLLVLGSMLKQALWGGQVESIGLAIALMCIGAMTFNLNYKLTQVLRRRRLRGTRQARTDMGEEL